MVCWTQPTYQTENEKRLSCQRVFSVEPKWVLKPLQASGQLVMRTIPVSTYKFTKHFRSLGLFHPSNIPSRGTFSGGELGLQKVRRQDQAHPADKQWNWDWKEDKIVLLACRLGSRRSGMRVSLKLQCSWKRQPARATGLTCSAFCPPFYRVYFQSCSGQHLSLHPTL